MVNNKSIFIPLNDNNNESNKENQQDNYMENRIPEHSENIEETFSWSDASTNYFYVCIKKKYIYLRQEKLETKKYYSNK